MDMMDRSSLHPKSESEDADESSAPSIDFDQIQSYLDIGE
jgi:hypothetical protein